MKEEYPGYIEGAKFLRLGQEIEEDFYPRDPLEYTPTDKFLDRFNELGGIITSDDVQETVRYGKLFPAARACACFVKDLGGVILYVVVKAEIVTDEDRFVPREADKSHPSADLEDFNHHGITIWPYVFDRDRAWNTGRWTGQDLDKIKELEITYAKE